ncbi:glutamate-1-semialdehyde 2,1-aminomutase 2 [Capsulimonas corticalis]|uniref:Glutamate-1-semialdehyde 2,1-aminomutase n=1 Tax=Capsulimonas corticalis TaxID=2219043 RepID=A0A402CP86_9BACT|nr:glutamate-1-semialdehyde 2,1-aminomutase [Capsulimonas corticalis]BDI33175.1 glutamate-1-semialdehyde 2,1-aminomutase 2 [Capsulimonas corticalis]
MSRNHSQSAALYAEAVQYIPGGVNSPVRAFKSVGGDPLFMERGAGSRIFDVDGNGYIDYVMSWGPLIFGHAAPRILEAITDAASRGTSFGASTAAEVTLAKKIVAAVPSIEKVRLVSSGTEAVMSAVRVARGFTKRDLIIKFEGNYHGHSDGFLAKSGSGLATFGLPDSAGVPANLTRDTITLPYNDIAAFREAFAAHKGEVACVMLEPIAGNMGIVPPVAGFLETLRELTAADGALLLFDEVITGFRVSVGGAQQMLGVTPDLTTLGKIIGGGLPLAAYGGRADIMDVVSPVGPVYQAGTLSGNPLAVAAGLEQLTILEEGGPEMYDDLTRKIGRLATATQTAADRVGVPIQINRIGSMMTTFFTETPVTDYTTAKTSDAARYAKLFRSLLEQGIYFAPSQFEAAFVSTAHTDEDLDATIAAVDKAFDGLV